MDATYINPALNAIIKVLTQMAHMQPKKESVALKTNTLARGDVSSIIDLEGESGKGSVAISFPQNVLNVIAGNMLPPGMPLSNEILEDLTGELANMLAGGMKGELEEHGLKYNISLPAVVKGSPHSVVHKVKAPVIMISFTTEVGPFFVEVAFDSGIQVKNKKRQSA